MPDRFGFAVPLRGGSGQAAAPTGLRVIKTHMPLDGLPCSPAARYVCVVRDPKDVFVSSYHFARAAFMGPLMPTVDAWLAAYLSADAPGGSWARHLASAWRLRERANVLFLTYERMHSDLPAAVDGIAAFMGVELSASERSVVIERSSFADMKKIGHKFDPPGAPWSHGRGAMIRRGERGASRELLTAQQQRRIDDHWRAELTRLGCDFAYDAAFNSAQSPAN